MIILPDAIACLLGYVTFKTTSLFLRGVL